MSADPFDQLSLDANDYYHSTKIDRISRPDPLFFYREYVSKNKPCIITGCIDHWPAFWSNTWSNAYLEQLIGDEDVTVAMTPNGRADAPLGEYFVEPHEQTLKFKDFLQLLTQPAENEKGQKVPTVYCQKQNGSLTLEYPKLFADIDPDIPFATKAFGCEPELINFWMGDDRSLSSLHHDPFENMYAVIAGEKTFTLIPPTDFYWLGQKRFTKARYLYQGNLADFGVPLKSGADRGDELDKSNADDDDDDDDNDNEANTSNANDDEGKRKEMRGDNVEINSKSKGKAIPARNNIASKLNDDDRLHDDVNNDENKGEVENGEYVLMKDSTDFVIVPDREAEKIPWFPVDPDADTDNQAKHTAGSGNHEEENAAQMHKASPIRCVVRAGELLYLPSMFYHQVGQRPDLQGRTIAVNYWYPMEFDIKYAYFRFMEKVAKAQYKKPTVSEGETKGL